MKQGYNARLNEHLGASNGKKSQFCSFVRSSS